MPWMTYNSKLTAIRRELESPEAVRVRLSLRAYIYARNDDSRDFRFFPTPIIVQEPTCKSKSR